MSFKNRPRVARDCVQPLDIKAKMFFMSNRLAKFIARNNYRNPSFIALHPYKPIFPNHYIVGIEIAMGRIIVVRR